MSIRLDSTGTDALSAEAFDGRLNELNLRVQRPTDDPVFTSEPQPPMAPVHWKGSDIQAQLDELSRQLQLSPGSGRRTLKLTNPGLAFGTTPTFWASIQYILPGEVATAHRHTPEAFRFVMQGTGCSTTVAGENYDMNEGDLVLTPGWAWHDHVHQGSEPMVWLDILDISLVRSFSSIFFEDHSDDIQEVSVFPHKGYGEYGSGIMRPAGSPSGSSENPLLAYPKEQAEAAINAAREMAPSLVDDVMLEYQNPATGAAAMKTLSIKSQLIRPGFKGLLHRHTGSKLYYVISGSGSTVVDNERFDWVQGDFFAVPSWARHYHENGGTEDARLFRVDDLTVLNKLGLYREEILQGGTQ